MGTACIWGLPPPRMARAPHEASPEGQDPPGAHSGMAHQPVLYALNQGDALLPLGKRLPPETSQIKPPQRFYPL